MGGNIGALDGTESGIEITIQNQNRRSAGKENETRKSDKKNGTTIDLFNFRFLFRFTHEIPKLLSFLCGQWKSLTHTHNPYGNPEAT